MTSAAEPVRVRRAHCAAAALSAVLAALALHAARAEGAAAPTCEPRGASAAYATHVERALLAKQDVWGNALLAAPGGPTYERANRYLAPLVLAAGRGRQPLTDSGVHYVPFGQPPGAQGASAIALHVADGSQIVSERADGRRLTVLVGERGDERYGSCLRRLAAPRLLEGYLPVLETSYVDASGAHYTQESFAIRLPETGSLVSLVQLSVDTRSSTAASTRVRLRPSDSGLTAAGNRLRRGAATQLVFGEGGTFDGSAVTYSFERGANGTVYAAWLNYPGPSGRADPRRGGVRARPRVAGRVLDGPPGGGHGLRGARPARARRDASARDPEPPAHVALQHRQPLRAVLVSRKAWTSPR